MIAARPLAPLYLAVSLHRWHQNPALAHTGQTNADHQGRCVLMLLALHPNPSLALIRAVATHDVGERVVGDLSRDFKRVAPVLARRHAEAEKDARETLFGADWMLSEGEEHWLKLVDCLDAACWCLHRAPAEYHRRASGWVEAEAALFLMADALNCGPAVRGLIHDLKSGEW